MNLRADGQIDRRKLSDDVVAKMYSDYLRLKSIRAAALLHGKTQQAFWEVLHRRGLAMPKRVHPRRIHNGRAFFLRPKEGFYYASRGDRRTLHYVIWEESHGRKVPSGHCIIFADRNHENFSPENLICLPMGEAVRFVQRGVKRSPHSILRKPEIAAYLKFRESLKIQRPAEFLGGLQRGEEAA